MRFESDVKNPWEKSQQENNLKIRDVGIREASELGWSTHEHLSGDLVKNTGKATPHFKNKTIPKGDVVTSTVIAIKEEVVKRVSQYTADTAKRKQEEAKKKEENNGAPILLLLAGIVFAVVFLFTTPIVILFNEVTSNEPKIVTAAKTELTVTEDNIGGVKYKEWYGINDNWCAMFVSYCANECEFIEEDIMPKSASVMNMSKWYKERGQWRAAEEYTPKAGDIIFFQNGMSHVGIVISYDAINKVITTIEGNTGEADTTLEHGHEWQISVCIICGGDHMTSEEQTCSTCKGKGYLLKKSGQANVYKDCSVIMEYTGCGSCGGSGKRTDYYNKYGCAFTDGNMKTGTGRTGENIFCNTCFGVGSYFGKVVRCTAPDCIMNSYGAWEDYPNGVCYTTECEYHEASRVKKKQYPLTYIKISGYGLPDYYKNWFEELFSGE